MMDLTEVHLVGTDKENKPMLPSHGEQSMLSFESNHEILRI